MPVTISTILGWRAIGIAGFRFLFLVLLVIEEQLGDIHVATCLCQADSILANHILQETVGARIGKQHLSNFDVVLVAGPV